MINAEEKFIEVDRSEKRLTVCQSVSESVGSRFNEADPQDDQPKNFMSISLLLAEI